MFCLTSTPSVGLPFINALGRRECPHKSERSVPWVGVLKCNLPNGDALGLRCYKIPLVLRLCHYKNAPPTQHRPDRVFKALNKFPPCPSFYKGIYSFWYKHGYLIVPRCHIFLRVFANGRYTLFSKLLYRAGQHIRHKYLKDPRRK